MISYYPATKQYFSTFAIDDISVFENKCPHLKGFTYTFTSGLDGLLLTRFNFGSTSAQIYNCADKANIVPGVPAIDHTTNSNRGSYFLFHTNSSYGSWKNTLSLQNIPADSKPSCFRFAYQYNGTGADFYVAKRAANSYSTVDLDVLWRPK